MSLDFCVPGREVEFMESLDEALQLARQLSVQSVNLLAGVRPRDTPEELALSVAVDNLAVAAAAAEAPGIALLIEAINPVDRPRYLVPSASSAAAPVRSAQSRYVRLQLDLYHSSVMGSVEDDLQRHRDLIGHVQLADHPGRHQPGTGTAPLQSVLMELEQTGYGGFVGLEYLPLGSTDASLGWLPRAARRATSDQHETTTSKLRLQR